MSIARQRSLGGRPLAFVLGALAQLGCGDYAEPGGAAALQAPIVGGTAAVIEDYPWQISLQVQGVQGGTQALFVTCGGAILDASWILTAQHCVLLEEPLSAGTYSAAIRPVSEVRVMAGSDMLFIGTSKVDEVITYPGYGMVSGGKDVALLHLTQPLAFSNVIEPIAMLSEREASQGVAGPGTIATATGWGLHASGGSINPADPLQQVDLDIVSDEDAQAAWGASFTVTDEMVGAGPTGVNEAGVCQGDSGGPLSIASPERVVGISSFVLQNGCGDLEIPSMFARVSTFARWVDSVRQSTATKVLSKTVTLTSDEKEYHARVGAGALVLSVRMAPQSGLVVGENTRLTLRSPSGALRECSLDTAPNASAIEFNDAAEACVVVEPEPGEWDILVSSTSVPSPQVSVVATVRTPASDVPLVAGGAHTCALLPDGRVKCWGDNSYGQLGLGDVNDRGDAGGEMAGSLPVLNLGSGSRARSLAAGRYHTCAIREDGSVKCWGKNHQGQLGLGDQLARGDAPAEMGNNLPSVNLGSGRTAVSLVAGHAHTCALLDNARVRCWGFNGYSAFIDDLEVGFAGGALGLGNTQTRGDGPGEMGDNLPYVNLGSGRTARALAAGEFHTCALLDNDKVKCWGDNFQGQLGLGDTATRGTGSGQMGDNLPFVALGNGRFAKAVAAGDQFSCAILDNESLKCWGNNAYGQLGLGNTDFKGDQPSEMGDNLPAAKVGSGRKVMRVVAGAAHTCALLDDDGLKCFGYNTQGQLGQGNTSSYGSAPGTVGSNLPKIKLGTDREARLVEAGDEHSCALLDNGTIKCWGMNSAGQLGLGDVNARGDAPNEMGQNLPAIVVQ